jgi:hypothetical protein
MENLHCSRGPVSSLPGSSHELPEGTKCDTHEDRLAVKRIQGETDSFGCEYVCMCQECLDEYRAYVKAELEQEHQCDWCKQRKKGLLPRRDPDEGQAGPLYQVCPECIAKDIERSAAELTDYYDDGYFF